MVRIDDGTGPRGGLRVAKGHGTQNDFVVVADPDGIHDLSPDLVRALCDRRAGIGGDGLIRVVPSAALPDGAGVAGQAEWFMDYRNADGSLAEMCGNGVRVFVAYLLRAGLAVPDADGLIAVGTRAGVVPVRREGEILALTLGRWFLPGGPEMLGRGQDVEVALAGEPVVLPGLRVDVGNPHVVVALPDPERLLAADLTRPPRVRPEPADGTNVELVVPAPIHDQGTTTGHLAMRVWERGVGETRSCGTGAVAAALAARAWAGVDGPDLWWVDVPGGRLRVGAPPGELVAGDRVELAGPAVIVAEGTVDPDWLATVRR